MYFENVLKCGRPHFEDILNRFFGLLYIHRLSEYSMIKIGNENDGGYVVIKELCEDVERVYSYGIGDDVSFETELLNLVPDTCRFQLFDPTIDALPEASSNRFEFVKKGIEGNLPNPIRIGEINILKVDVEGLEWYAFERRDVTCFTQILLELHIFKSEIPSNLSPYFQKIAQQFCNRTNYRIFLKYLEILRKLTDDFYIYHMHANNSLPLTKIGPYTFPPLLEVSLVNKKCVGLKLDDKCYPYLPVDGLDKPNKTDRPDIKGWYPIQC